ncbi:MAG: phage holin family protein [Bacteroidota bacterium]|nr:phage holin family protein [Bacteroidota bacterium]MDX5404648.1 phage holin family protein [Bacteroidota bacterium]MDX5426478.1 phage holin family protein [Bacteroidota bacterium]MDX5504505.1 phage holin family protein [Bacteroidota bacterium]
MAESTSRGSSWLVTLIVNTLSVFAVAYILPGVKVDQFTTALIVAIVLAVLNVFLKPILIILTLPLTVVTFGLFLVVINALVILLTDNMIDGFSVDGFWWAVLFSILISIVNSVLFGLGGKGE